uniref:ATP synthase F0 subunit 8 n=1 Tax=Dipterosiphonia australica TaxID=2007208 RepID=UPI0022FD69C0|nr:ATP synthase F0 subunit 8 [Dipterosiphonia australica]WAX04243.1 ATP synthase F0 subunit 8 [Dipterosiphonia australica]
MPQLDFLIILPQIFWLTIFFISFYFVLTYYFLPFFIKTIESRNKFISYNQEIEVKLRSKVLQKRQNMLKTLNLTFAKIHSILFINLFTFTFTFVKPPFKNEFLSLNKKILSSLKNTIFFCNSILLNSFKFYPSFLKKIN